MPLFAYQAATFLSHVPTLLFGALAMLAVARWGRSRRDGWLVLFGLAVGCVFLIRPVDAALIGLSLIAFPSLRALVIAGATGVLLGVPLSAGRSLAIDPLHVPLGAPVFLDTTWRNSKQPLQRLMLARAPGGAIRGAGRGDYFWGFGEQAGVQAGRMRQPGRMWVLAPNGTPPESLLAR